MAMLLDPVPYDTDWPQKFAALRDRLLSLPAMSTARIEHIGSTAVEGLWAKPIIDIQVGVVSLEPFPLEELAKVGFEPVPEIDRDDPFPNDEAGFVGWRKKYARLTEGGRRLAHVHIRQVGDHNHRFAILFRDFLRANRHARDFYSEFKKTAADVGRDMSEQGGSGAYLDLKDPFVKVLALNAEGWANETGWCDC